MRYIGIDLAWGEKATTGCAALDAGGSIIASALAQPLDEIIQFTVTYAGDSCLVGVDAPLIVPNETGVRECERALARRGIPTYPANRKILTERCGSVRGETLVGRLAAFNFVLTDTHPAEIGTGRFIYEVYPWAVLRHHFGRTGARRDITPRYKSKPGVAKSDVQTGILEVRDALRHLTPPISFDEGSMAVSLSDDSVRSYNGTQLKRAGDIIDAMLCAHAVYAAHSLGRAGGEIVGDTTSGFILVPPER